MGALAGALLFTVSAAPAAALDFPVTNTDDSGPGSLRQAIQNFNDNSGTDHIVFADLGPSPKIAPVTPLPDIIEQGTIDGYTHPGASPNTATFGNNAVIRVELSGENLSGSAIGLRITGGDVTVRGLVINRFGGAAISIGAPIGGNRIAGNFIGTDRTGLAAAGNLDGIDVVGIGANTIGGTTAADRNVIAGNSGLGILLVGGASPEFNTFNKIQGNYIGVDKTGLAALVNGGHAVGLAGAGDTEVGAAGVLGRNVIAAAPGQDAIRLEGDTTERTTIRSNFVGTDRTGTATLGDAFSGVSVWGAEDTVIGGSTQADGNVIAGAAAHGILLLSGTPTTVRGNRIGTNAAGTAALPNGHGVNVQGAGGDVIGGTAAGERNLISGNSDGVVVHADGVSVLGNRIGTDITGNAPLPNSVDGVRAHGDDLQLGGHHAAARNVIAGHGRYGVLLSGVDGANVQANHVGIGADGVTAMGNGEGVRIENGAQSVDVGGLSPAPGAPPGNVISGNLGSGVTIRQLSAVPPRVNGNLIGTSAAGTAAVGNGDDGVAIRNGAQGVVIGALSPNVISGNDMAGVYISASDDNAVVGGNHIGVNRAGAGAVPNGTGVDVAGGASGNQIGAGGGVPNVISGNRFEGVFIHGAETTGNAVALNRIGTRADGTAAVANHRGVVIAGGAQENTIGDPLAFGFGSGRNTISGNATDGVLITGGETNRNLVRGNSIGTRLDGLTALPNGVGVNITGGARQNTVESSVISGNRTAGVRIADAATFGNRVLRSFVGTGANGAEAVPNGSGVVVTAGAQSTTLRANRIALNTASGVVVDGTATSGAELTLNRIFGNGKLGINLRPAGEPADTLTANDAGDADTGPNGLQNFPVITAASGATGTTTVSGTLNSRPNARYRIEVFRNPAGSAATAQAETHAGTTTVTTDAAGDASWTVAIPGDLGGEVLRATATRLTTRDTSELSVARVVG
jgi:hypothetical protein